MIYVGESLPGPRGYGTDSCLLNPSLPVADSAAPGDDLRLGYWPDYASLTPSGRRAYINWLAGGRSDPKADTGLVVLFLYGLERRLFLDREMPEAAMLAVEVERLVGIYGDRIPFGFLARNFLTGASLLVGGGPLRIEPCPPAEMMADELPLSTQLHLGAVLAEGRPLGADDALLWILGAPATRLRTPGQRCFAELRQLFGARFGELHPKGLTVREPKRRISASYRSAGNSFSVAIPGAHENLPDISAISAPLAGLRDLLEACQSELDPYSRLLGRRPVARGTLEAAMLLPASLRAAATAKAAQSARQGVLPLLGGATVATVAPRALFEAVGVTLDADARRPPASALSELQQRLDILDLGIEPDRRYGGDTTSLDAKVVLFEADGGAPVNPDRPGYLQAKAAIEVAMLAAATDGDVTGPEFDAVISDVRSMPGLSPAEAIRLKAFAWTLRDRAKAGGALRRAASLPPEARKAIARAAVAAVLADGQASRIEVAFLERLHKTLGLPPEAVHSALHQGVARDPAAARPVSAPGQAGGVVGKPAIALDTARLARIQQETAQVSSLLSGIFADDAEPPAEDAPPPAAPATQRPARFEGLDGQHGTLLEAVLAGAPMPMPDFEAQAREMRLFVEGAIETINDWAFDRYGEPILEAEGNTVTIADHLRAELQPS
jgi:tellurite resistance protein